MTYACQPGYNHTDGDLTRTCQANGSLTGSTPVCTSKLPRWLCISLLYCGHVRIYRRSYINNRLKHIQMLWKKHLKKAGNTYIFNTHDMHDMQYRVNRRWVLSNRKCQQIDFIETKHAILMLFSMYGNGVRAILVSK